MTWKEIETAWHELVDGILAQWPAMSCERVLAIAGDRAEFTRYIAESHDLTMSEAAEALDMWMIRIFGRIRDN